MFGSKKYPLKDQLTILLLIVFVLVKANPCYYIFQYPASSVISSHSRQSTSLDNSHQTDHFLIKLDKSISESVDNKHVPEIKFTGIPFALFFLILPVVFCRRAIRPFSYTLSPGEACISTCILRL